MAIADFQLAVYQAIQEAALLAEIGSQTRILNPAYDWKTEINPPEMPEYLFGIYTREHFERTCARVKSLIEKIPDEYLGPKLIHLKQGQYDATCYEIKEELEEALEAVHYPGRIRALTAVFRFQEHQFKVLFWPEGEVNTHFRVPSLASREIFEISGPVYEVLMNTSELKVPLAADDPALFIKVEQDYSKY